MRSHEDDAEYYKIPPLGKHYADKWSHEDMLEEQRQGTTLYYLNGLKDNQ